jgi:hypothetical protein
MAFVRKGDAGWARKLRPEHARQHRAEGGSIGFSPPSPTEAQRAERQRIYNQGLAVKKAFNTSLPGEPPLSPAKDD